jgi:hypothetical protein
VSRLSAICCEGGSGAEHPYCGAAKLASTKQPLVTDLRHYVAIATAIDSAFDLDNVHDMF